MTERLSLATEYSYVDLGSEEITRDTMPGFPTIVVDEDLAFHTLKASINYRF